jgi:aminoglycoside phosphotransferase (APT) family kinase protein
MTDKEQLSTGRVAQELGPWFSVKLGQPVTVTQLSRTSEGFSWVNYTLTVTADDRATGDPAAGEPRTWDFAIRQEPDDGVLAPYDTRWQYTLNRAVALQKAVPVPEIYWLETDPAVLGRPFYVMERMRGEVPTPDVQQPFRPEERSRLAGQLVDHLVSIHRIDWAGPDFTGVLRQPASAGQAASDELELWTEFYERAALVEIPAVQLGLSWLRANQAASGTLVFCHGDYRNGNFMVDRGNISAIFDWELAHVGDPVEDLGWCSMRAFQGRSGLVAHLLTEQEFIAGYEARTGLHVDPEVLRFWRVLGNLKALGSYIRGCRAFEERRTNDLRLASFGHRGLYLIKGILDEIGYGAAQ